MEEQPNLLSSLTGGIYKPSPVSEKPSVNISSWSIKRVPDPTEEGSFSDHIVGYNMDSCDGRVSSKIKAFDPKTKICITGSGRRYKLYGEPGYDSDADYVWNRWLSINNVEQSEVKIVTREYLPKPKT